MIGNHNASPDGKHGACDAAMYPHNQASGYCHPLRRQCCQKPRLVRLNKSFVTEHRIFGYTQPLSPYPMLASLIVLQHPPVAAPHHRLTDMRCIFCVSVLALQAADHEYADPSEQSKCNPSVFQAQGKALGVPVRTAVDGKAIICFELVLLRAEIRTHCRSLLHLRPLALDLLLPHGIHGLQNLLGLNISAFCLYRQLLCNSASSPLSSLSPIST